MFGDREGHKIEQTVVPEIYRPKSRQ